MEPICPRCGSVDIHPHALKDSNGVCQRVRCYSCGMTFQREYKERPNPLDDIKVGLPVDFGSYTGLGPVNVGKTVRRNQFLHKTLEAGDRAVILFDAHLDPQRGPHSSYLVAKKYIMETKPEWIVFGGDFLEFNSLCAWNFNKRLLLEGKRYKADIEMGYKELSDIRLACLDSQMIFFAGNHENRVPRYIEQHPEVEEILNVKDNLRIEEALGAKWIEYNKTWELGELVYLHGYYYNKYFARSTLEAIGKNCIFGHAHKSQTWSQRLKANLTPHIAVGIGCLTDVDPEWKAGKPTNFINSFAIIEYREKGYFNIHEIIVVDGAFSYGGQTWEV